MQLIINSTPYFTSFCLLVFALLFNIFSEGVIQQLPQNLKFPAVFAFGDSLLDHGNNNGIATVAKCNYPPYGKDFEGGVPTGRFTNGRTPVDLIAEKLGITNVIPAYLDPNLTDQDLPMGVSFASGASGYDPQTPKLTGVLSLSDQLQLLRDYTEKLKGAIGEERSKDILSNSLHFVSAGSNDLNIFLANGVSQSKYNISSYTDLLVTYATSFVQNLYKLGAKRIAIFGIPPLGCLPAQRTLTGGIMGECDENHNQGAQLMNEKLSRELDLLTQSLPHSRVVYLDFYDPVFDLIQHPQTYGIGVSDRGCCGTGTLEILYLCNKFTMTCANTSNFVFWDTLHPTDKGYQVLVDQILPKHISRFF